MIEKLEMRVTELEKQLSATKKVLSFEEASKFLNLSKSYLYQLTSKALIPHYKPQGKMLYFEREELEKWLMKNPVKSRQELRDEASDKFLYPTKKKIKTINFSFSNPSSFWGGEFESEKFIGRMRAVICRNIKTKLRCGKSCS